MTKPAAEFKIEGLSHDAEVFLRDHPAKAREALEAAARQVEEEVIAFREPYPGPLPRAPRVSSAPVGHEAGSDVAKALERLEKFVVKKNRMLRVSDAASQLDRPTSTVYSWLRRNALIGWKKGAWGTVIPAEQILGPDRIVPGIKRLLDIIQDPEIAWIFLSEEWPFRTEVKRPIEKLRNGEVDDVLNAAPGFGTAFT